MPSRFRTALARGRRADIDAYASYVIAALAFALSYSKLVDLAARAGYGEHMSLAWPLIVDGLAVMAARGVLRLGKGRWYPWALLVAGTAVSILAAVMNAMVPPGPLSPGATAAVTIVPALCLPFAAHLARKMRDAGDVSPSDVAPAEVASRTGVAQESDATVEVTDVTPDVTPSTPVDVAEAVTVTTEQDATLRLVEPDGSPRRRTGKYTDAQKAEAIRCVTEEGMSLRDAGHQIGGAPGETVRRWILAKARAVA